MCVLTVALDVLMLSWSDLLELLCTSHTHIHPRDDWHKGYSLEHGCRCIAVAVLLYTEFVTATWCGCFCKRKTPLFLTVLCANGSTHSAYRSVHSQTQKHRS